ncbi:MAG: FecR domain-containing protein [bacterium]|nr:FecR domain-containing protein [bacterium]
MNRFRWAFWAFLPALVMLTDGRFTRSAERKGIVAFAEGEVRKQPPASEMWENAPVQSAVNSGEKVRTYQMSRAELELIQLDIIRLAPKTTVLLDRLYEETREKKLATSIKVEKGEIWASVHEVNAETEFDISAPVAAAAITGTVLRMTVRDDSTTQLKVYKGEVKITNAPEKPKTEEKPSGKPTQIEGPKPIQGPREVSLDEWVYIVKGMQQITIDPKGIVLSMGQFSRQDMDEQTDWVKWNAQRENIRQRRLQNLMQKSR